tara:strand:+ start:119 stop:811 length:693 start_codon:yes stop_codon:yes gene_type:complete
MKKFFIVMGLPRSGTTAVRTALDSHSQIKCEYEMFNEAYNEGKPWSIKQIDDTFDYLDSIDTSATGLHHNFDLPRKNHREHVWNQLRERSTHCVVLKRTDKIKHFLSVHFAWKYEHWHDWLDNQHNLDKKELPAEEHISVTLFKKFLEEWGEMEREMFAEAQNLKSHIVVDYEEFTRYTGRELRRIQEYLDVPFERIFPRTKKFNRQTKITNIDELEEVYARHTLDTIIK